MVGRGLRTICPTGEDHPGLLQGEMVMLGKMSSSCDGGGFWTWAMRAMMGINVSISILLPSSQDLLTGCHGKRLLETI